MLLGRRFVLGLMAAAVGLLLLAVLLLLALPDRPFIGALPLVASGGCLFQVLYWTWVGRRRRGR